MSQENPQKIDMALKGASLDQILDCACIALKTILLIILHFRFEMFRGIVAQKHICARMETCRNVSLKLVLATA